MLWLLSLPFRLVYRVLRICGILEVTRLLHLPQSECRRHECADGFEVRELTSQDLEQLTEGDAKMRKRIGQADDLTDPRRSLVAVVHANKIVSFLWMGKQSIEGANNYSHSVHLGTSIDMPDGTAFVYNAWTAPEYRGKRLVACMLSWATRKRVVGAWAAATTTDWTNDKSLAAFTRIGMRQLGWVLRFGLGPLQLSLVPIAAKRIGFRVAEQAPGFKLGV